MSLGQDNISTVWALVANSNSARIFEIVGRGTKITKLHQFNHPRGRLKSGELNTDRPGRGNFGPDRRFALDTEVSPHEHEQTVFAKELALILSQARESKKFNELTLVAPPQFLGKLNQAMNGTLKKCITNEFHRNLPESLSDSEIIEHLCKYLNLK